MKGNESKMWVDKGAYWAFTGKGNAFRPPSNKHLEYASLNSKNGVHFKLCVGVWDVFDDYKTYTPMNRDELEVRLAQGWKLEYSISANEHIVINKGTWNEY